MASFSSRNCELRAPGTGGWHVVSCRDHPGDLGVLSRAAGSGWHPPLPWYCSGGFCTDGSHFTRTVPYSWLSTLIAWFSKVLPAVLWGSYHYPHFMRRKRLGDDKGLAPTQPARAGVWSWTQVLGPNVQSSMTPDTPLVAAEEWDGEGHGLAMASLGRRGRASDHFPWGPCGRVPCWAQTRARWLWLTCPLLCRSIGVITYILWVSLMPGRRPTLDRGDPGGVREGQADKQAELTDFPHWLISHEPDVFEPHGAPDGLCS